MKNTMDYNNKNVQAATVAVMNDLLASDVCGTSMEDAYNAVCKYAKVTKEQFNELYKKASEKIAEWKDNGSLCSKNCELNEDALDMVVGGSSVGDFFSVIGEGIVAGAKATGNFVKEHSAEIAMVAGIALLATGIGAGVGFGLMGGEIGAAVIGGCFGGACSIMPITAYLDHHNA